MRRFMPLLFLFVGGIIGFGLAQWLHSPDRKPDANTTTTASPRAAILHDDRAPLPLDQIKRRLAAALDRGYFREDRHWHELIESITTADMPTVVATVQSSDSTGRNSFLSALYERWGLLDPTAALASAQNASPDNEELRYQYIYEVLQGWAYTDVRGMAAWTLQLDHGRLRQSAVRAMSDFPDDLDLETVIQIARAQANHGNNHMFFGLWTERDPAAAAAFATATLRIGSDRDWILKSVAQTWVRQDPAGALNWFAGLDRASQMPLVYDFFGTLANRNPSLAASMLEEVPPGPIRNRTAERTMELWASKNHEDAFAWLLQQPLNSSSNQLFSTVGFYAGRAGFDLAQQLAEQLPNSKTHKLFLDSARRGLAEADPAAAWEVVRQLDAGDAKDNLVKSIIDRIGATDPVGAIRMLSETPEVNGTAYLTANLIVKVAADDLAAAVDLIKLLPNVESRDFALLRLLREDGGRDFEMNALLASALSPGPATTKALTTIAERYATYHPEAAITWLNTLPQNSDKDAATVAMIGRIYGNDPATATALAFGLPAGTDREKAIGLVASQASHTDTTKAVNWAKSLSGGDRTAALSRVAVDWLLQDPEEATQFLATLTTEDLDTPFLNDAAVGFSKSPAFGTQIVDKLPPSELRNGVLTTMVKAWLEDGSFQIFAWEDHPLRKWQLLHPGQPAAWLEKAELPPEIKQDLRHIADGGKLPR